MFACLVAAIVWLAVRAKWGHDWQLLLATNLARLGERLCKRIKLDRICDRNN